jgi:hypothetical protein
MSTYLYIRCEDCQEDSDVIGRNTIHEDGLEDSLGITKWRLSKEAIVYLVKHKGHRVRLIDEFQQNPDEWPGWGQK